MGVVFDYLLNKLRIWDAFWTSSTPKLFTWTGNPNWVVTPTKAWDEYQDTSSGLKYFAQSTANDSWVEINFTI